jgi:predicted nuclease of predicted toxin-antitoxin system
VKVLVDNCVAASASAQLVSLGHEVVSVADMPADPGDQSLLDLASNEGRVLVTLDKDFGELAVLHRARHAGIVRLVGISAKMHGTAAHQAMQRYGEELSKGAIVTVTPGRVRVRLLGLTGE